MSKENGKKDRKGVGGRPTKYKTEYCEKIIKYFEIIAAKPNREIVYSTGVKIIPNDLPFLRDFAKSIGVRHCTIIDWEKKYPEFSESVKEAIQIRKQMLIKNALQSLYPTGTFCFVAKNLTDMRDQQDVNLSGTVNVMGSITVNGEPFKPDVGD